MFERVGALYLREVGAGLDGGGRALCTTLLVSARWSLAPAHCAAARADPALAEYLPRWALRYNTQSQLIDTGVARSFTHPHFNPEDFRNNIGLLQHAKNVNIGFDFQKPATITSENDFQAPSTVELIGYYQSDINYAGSLKRLVLQHMTRDSCSGFVTPVTNLRPYEHCFVPSNGDTGSCFDHGAILAVNSNIVGFFSWSEKCGNQMFPYVVVNITEFREWLQHVYSMH